MAVEQMTQELPAAATTGEEGHCEVLQGADGPVYFLHQGLLFIVHDLLGRWAEPGEVHWLVSASVGRFGEPALYRLRCRHTALYPADLAVGGAKADGNGGVDGGGIKAEHNGIGDGGGGFGGGLGGLRGRIGPADPYQRPGPGRWTVRRAANGSF